MEISLKNAKELREAPMTTAYMRLTVAGQRKKQHVMTATIATGQMAARQSRVPSIICARTTAAQACWLAKVIATAMTCAQAHWSARTVTMETASKNAAEPRKVLGTTVWRHDWQ